MDGITQLLLKKDDAQEGEARCPLITIDTFNQSITTLVDLWSQINAVSETIYVGIKELRNCQSQALRL